MGMSMEPVEGQIDIRTAAAMTYSDMIGVMGMGWWMDPIKCEEGGAWCHHL